MLLHIILLNHSLPKNYMYQDEFKEKKRVMWRQLFETTVKDCKLLKDMFQTINSAVEISLSKV